MLVGYCITKKQSFWPDRNRTLEGYCVTRKDRTVNDLLQKNGSYWLPLYDTIENSIFN
jgi:hypothetical protein